MAAPMMLTLGNFLFQTRMLLLPLAALALLMPGPVIFRTPLTAVLWGFVIGLSGLAIRILAIGLNQSSCGGCEQRASEVLVVDGFYAHSRNPIYLGSLLLLTALLITANSWLALLIVPVGVLVYRSVVTAEERELGKKFGNDYSDYVKDVPRWGPRLSGLCVTMSHSRFLWRRVAAREFWTVGIWLAGMALVGMHTLAR